MTRRFVRRLVGLALAAIILGLSLTGCTQLSSAAANITGSPAPPPACTEQPGLTAYSQAAADEDQKADIRTAKAFFQEHCFTETQAAGVIGVLITVSSFYHWFQEDYADPSTQAARDLHEPRPGIAFGISAWRGGVGHQGLQDMAAHLGGAAGDLNVQLAYLLKDMKETATQDGTDNVFGELIQAGSIEEAIDEFATDYLEIPAAEQHDTFAVYLEDANWAKNL